MSVSKAVAHSIYLATKQTLESKNIHVKTVVIDGVVRENGPLYPQDVANTFLNAHNTKNQDLFIVQ